MTKNKILLPETFNRPPLLFRTINSAWKSSYSLGTKISLDKDGLIKSARKLTGLYDLGNDFNDVPLNKLLESVNEEANLHPVGRFITKQRFVSLLSIRLRAEYYFKKYPEILEQELYPAWLIIGLQRTGTTKLQRLLALDAEHRVIPSWEVINPLPLKPLKYAHIHHNGQVDRERLKVARLSVNALKLMSPGFFAIHPIDINQPEEDILLLDVSFMSTTPEAMMYVPSYAQWLEQTDQTSAYAYMVKILKYLQWARPAKRWILKSPHHLEFTKEIEKTFNDVRFIWPHRNIYESVPSFLSMATYNHMIFSDHIDVNQIGRHWTRKTGYMLEKAIEYRNIEHNNDRFSDIHYSDLIRDSISELTKIYNMNGGFPGVMKEYIARFEKEHPQRKYGHHNYSLADFDLTTGDIDVFTTHYRQFTKQLYGNK